MLSHPKVEYPAVAPAAYSEASRGGMVVQTGRAFGELALARQLNSGNNASVMAGYIADVNSTPQRRT
jgi:hypothetical protein